MHDSTSGTSANPASSSFSLSPAADTDGTLGGRHPTAATTDYTLTSEEEAALLAEYGVTGAFDELLRIPAASHFRSEVTGELNVFLTGGPAGDDDGDMDCSNVPQASPQELLYDPLDALLLKYADATRAGAPNSLVDHLGTVVASASTSPVHRQEEKNEKEPGRFSADSNVTGPPSSHASSSLAKYAGILRDARQQERRLQNVVRSGWFPAAGSTTESGDVGKADDDKDTAALLHETERLLAQGNAFLAQPTQVDRQHDEELKQRLAALEVEYQLEVTDDVDVFLGIDDADQGDEGSVSADDAEAQGILRTAALLVGRHTHRKQSQEQEDDTEEKHEETMTIKEVAQPAAASPKKDDPASPRSDVAPSRTEPSLYAFEHCPTSEELTALEAWDALLLPEDTLAIEIEAHASSALDDSSAVAKANALLAFVRDAEERSVAALTAIEAKYQSSRRELSRNDRSSNQPPTTAEKRKEDEKQGLLVLDAFREAVNRLLPSETAVETTISGESQTTTRAAAIADRNGTLSESYPDELSGKGKRKEVESTASIEQRARRQLWLVTRETAEARAMRLEEQRAERLLLARELEWEAIVAALVNTVTSETLERQAHEQVEFDARKELLAREKRLRELTRRAAAVRETKAVSAVVQQISGELEAVRTVLVESEAQARAALEAAMRESLADAVSRQERRQAREKAQRIEEERQRRADFEAKRAEMLHESMGMLTSEHATSDERKQRAPETSTRAINRPEQLKQEAEAVTAWVNVHQKHLQETVALLREEAARSTAETKRFKSTTQGAYSSYSFPWSLGADSAAQKQHSRPLTPALLEKLIPLQMIALAKCPEKASQILHTVSLALDGIDDIDYASLKDFTKVVENDSDGSATHRITVTQHVTSLNLGSNALSALSLVGLQHVFPSLRELEVSDNKIEQIQCPLPGPSRPGSSAALSQSTTRAHRGVAAAQQNAWAERCTVRSLNLNSNALTDVGPIALSLSSSLYHLSLVANKLTSLAPLQGCQRLCCLEANRNGLSSVADILPLSLLQRVNLCDNDLMFLDDSIAHHLCLLTKLYLSNNPRLTHLPSGGECFLFLEQLFLNQCSVTSVTADNFPWMPSLSVLHMEGNKLTDVSGLFKCPRLVTLNVAFNSLSDVGALTVLSLCQRIEVLDVRGNPFLSTKTAVPTAAARVAQPAEMVNAATRTLRSWLPLLRELNSEPLPLERTEDTHRPLMKQSSENENLGLLDGFLSDERTVREVTALFAQRQEHAAETVDERHAQAVTASATNAAVAAAVAKPFAPDVRQRSHVKRTTTLADSLNRMLRVCVDETGKVTRKRDASLASAVAMANRHFLNPIYEEKQRAASERNAALLLLRHLRGGILVRRARAELAALRAAHHESLVYRQEMAARRIQPVWRGAVLRARLARILHGGRKGTVNDDDDDEEFQKVDLDFDTDRASLQPTSITDLLKRAMAVEGSGDGLEDGSSGTQLFHRFDVPATVVHPTAPSAAAALQHASNTNVLDVTAQTRAGSAPFHNPQQSVSGQGRVGRGSGSNALHGQRPASETQLQPHPPAQVRLAGNGDRRPQSQQDLTQQQQQGGSTDPAWGEVVAAQIKKKNKKMQRVHQDYVRNEYVRDPLNAKKLNAGNSSARN